MNKYLLYYCNIAPYWRKVKNNYCSYIKMEEVE